MNTACMMMKTVTDCRRAVSVSTSYLHTLPVGGLHTQTHTHTHYLLMDYTHKHTHTHTLPDGELRTHYPLMSYSHTHTHTHTCYLIVSYAHTLPAGELHTHYLQVGLIEESRGLRIQAKTPAVCSPHSTISQYQSGMNSNLKMAMLTGNWISASKIGNCHPVF